MFHRYCVIVWSRGFYRLIYRYFTGKLPINEGIASKPLGMFVSGEQKLSFLKRAPDWPHKIGKYTISKGPRYSLVARQQFCRGKQQTKSQKSVAFSSSFRTIT